MMQSIILTKGKVALVSEEDYDMLNKHKWCAQEYSPGKWRAKRARIIEGKHVTIYMHREVIKAEPGQITDHINQDGLDNRRTNLRIVDKQRNAANSTTKSKSGYKGVEARNGYRAYITVDKNRLWLGKFNTAKEAAQYYDKISIEWFGEYASLNFPEKGER